MEKEFALKLIGIDFSEIRHEEQYENHKCVVFGIYQGEQIDMYDHGDNFVIGLGVGRKNYRVYKDTGKIEEFEIFVA